MSPVRTRMTASDAPMMTRVMLFMRTPSQM
jgi:hypothetical protein